MALELTLGLIAVACVLFFVLRARGRSQANRAADAARKAVETRMRRGED